MRKRLSWGAALSLMIIVVAVTVCVTMLIAMRRFNAQVNELNNRQSMYTYIAEADGVVRQNYYGTIDEEILRHAMAAGEIAGLNDPYAAFLTAEEYTAWQEARSGQSTGFGLDVVLSDGVVTVSAVQQGSTAYSAGLQKGDLITGLNKAALGDDPLAEVQKALTGSSTVLLTVERDGQETAFELSSSMYLRESVEYSLMDTTGYIRIKALTDATPDQFKAAYSTLKDQAASELVLDLRGIATGSPKAAKEILSFVLPYGLYGYYQSNAGTEELRSEQSTGIELPTAVLINSRTAGEAELIAASLKQAGIATLVGSPSAGRARVQECFAISSDQAAICLTVGEFQLLGNESWEGKGLTPDVLSPLTAEQDQAVDLIPVDMDVQLRQAIASLKTGTQAGTTTTAAQTTTTAQTQTTTASEPDAADTEE